MKRLKESKTLSSKAFAKIKGTKLEATETRGVRAGTARGQYNKKEKSSYEKIYDGLFDLEYTPYATKNGGLEISRKYSKNLNKARELLNKLGVNFKERESRGRTYIDISLPSQEKERVLESSKIDISKYNEVFVKYSDSTMGESYTLKREDDLETLFRIIKKDIQSRIEKGKNKFSLEIDFDLSLLSESKSSSKLNESVDFVKSYLQGLVSNNRVRALKDDERLPRGFKFLSSTGTSGEVEYRGIRYAFALLPSGKLNVMTSSQAGWNWSETIYKEETSGYDHSKARENYKGYDIFPTVRGFKAIDYNGKEKFKEETLDDLYRRIDKYSMSTYRRETRAKNRKTESTNHKEGKTLKPRLNNYKESTTRTSGKVGVKNVKNN